MFGYSFILWALGELLRMPGAFFDIGNATYSPWSTSVNATVVNSVMAVSSNVFVAAAILVGIFLLILVITGAMMKEANEYMRG